MTAESNDTRAGAGDGSVAAFFDVDGTLARTTIVHYYDYLRRRMMSPPAAALWHLAYLGKCLGFVLLDRISRNKLNVVFYRDYRGLSVDRVKNLAPACYADVLAPCRFQEGVTAVQEHKQAGHRVVLVTGSLDFLIQPLAQDLGIDTVIAARLVESGGVFTGQLAGPPIGGEEKAVRIRQFAGEQGIDLARSYGYGDSLADLPMLEAIGLPRAVNPDRSLARVARSRGWPIHRWITLIGPAKNNKA